MVLAYECKLQHQDLDTMSVGQVLDYIDTFVDMKNPDKKSNTIKQASQADFDAF